MGVYVFSRDVLLEVLEQDSATDFGREIIPAALGRYRVHAHLFRGYWADVGTIASFYDANIMLTRPGAPFKFYDPRPADLHAPALSARAPGSSDCTRRATRSSPRGATSIAARSRSRSSASARTSRRGADDPALGAARRRLLRSRRRRAGAAATTRGSASAATSCSIASSSTRTRGSATARGWSTTAGVQDADGDGYYIRDGVIIVPKDGVIRPGTQV